MSLNVLGFFAYSIANFSLLLSPIVRSEYASRHGGGRPSVRWNDVAFSTHALVVSALTWLQTRLYRVSISPQTDMTGPDSTSQREVGQRLSDVNRTVLSILVVIILTVTVLAALSESGVTPGTAPEAKGRPSKDRSTEMRPLGAPRTGDTLEVQWLDLVLLLSTIKVCRSCLAPPTNRLIASGIGLHFFRQICAASLDELSAEEHGWSTVAPNALGAIC